ncbi:hypothetical protein Tco_1542846 [Tanacetum coccineum]
MAYVNSAPYGFVSISPAPEPSTQDEPFVNNVHGSGSTSGSAISSSGDPSSGGSTNVINSSCSLGAVLKKGNDFSDDFDKNLFKLANFPFSFCTSLMHLGDGKLRTVSAFSGHALNPWDNLLSLKLL